MPRASTSLDHLYVGVMLSLLETVFSVKVSIFFSPSLSYLAVKPLGPDNNVAGHCTQ